LRTFSARCYGPRMSIFGPVSSLMELNIRAKTQGRSSNITFLSHWRPSAWVQLENRFFARKISEVEPLGVYFVPLFGSIVATFFGMWEIFVTRGSGPWYSCQNFIPGGPWSSPCNALENLPPPLRFEKLGKSFWGLRRAQGGLEPKFLGIALKWLGGSLEGPLKSRIKSVLNRWRKALWHSSLVKKSKFCFLGAFLGHCSPRTSSPQAKVIWEYEKRSA